MLRKSEFTGFEEVGRARMVLVALVNFEFHPPVELFVLVGEFLRGGFGTAVPDRLDPCLINAEFIYEVHFDGICPGLG